MLRVHCFPLGEVRRIAPGTRRSRAARSRAGAENSQEENTGWQNRVREGNIDNFSSRRYAHFCASAAVHARRAGAPRRDRCPWIFARARVFSFVYALSVGALLLCAARAPFAPVSESVPCVIPHPYACVGGLYGTYLAHRRACYNLKICFQLAKYASRSGHPNLFARIPQTPENCYAGRGSLLSWSTAALGRSRDRLHRFPTLSRISPRGEPRDSRDPRKASRLVDFRANARFAIG